MGTPIENVEEALSAIATHGRRTNAFILVDAEAARSAARATSRGPLAGMTISIKDLIDIEGQPTTAGSRVRDGHVAEHDAPVVQRLRNAGAILIGKTNLHEFAFGTTSEESAFGAVHNPLDVTRSAGGSSGGSAAAVASGMGRASIGTDTGGSIRIPAAACGIVGLKPSLGEVPTDGVVALSTTFDHVGPITRDVADAALIWSVLAEQPMPALDLGRAPRLGLLGGYFTKLLERDVRSAFDAAIERLRREGATTAPRELAHADSIVPAYVNISMPEAAHWHGADIDEHANDYQPPVLERLHRGRTILAVDYLAAFDTRETLRRAVDDLLADCDALALPTLPIIPPSHGQVDAMMGNGETIPVRAAMLRLTQLFNITGHPAISVPVPVKGLPVGLQLVGRRGRTDDLLRVAARCESLLRHPERP
ncbi:MAG TPA: amidase [Gemmatimonadaceae bacterium]|nr:amidase [Gemmatimonadaceae bacterium]